jgi:hypothetical protein
MDKQPTCFPRVSSRRHHRQLPKMRYMDRRLPALDRVREIVAVAASP